MIPYFLLASIMILITWANNDYSLQVLSVILNGVCFQKRSWTIWYLACLVWVELLAWLICKFTRLAILRIVIAFLCLIVAQIYYRLGGPSLFWNFDIAWIAVSFYILGKEKVYITVPASNLGLKKGIILLCILGCCFFLNSQISQSFLNLGGGTVGFWPITYLGAICGISFIIYISQYWECKIFELIGKNSLIIFAWHNAIIRPIILKLFEKTGVTFSTEYSRIIISGTIILVVSLLCSICVNKMIKWLHNHLGKLKIYQKIYRKEDKNV